MHFVWEEIGDVLHGLGEDRGWTSKPDVVWEEIGKDSTDTANMLVS